MLLASAVALLHASAVLFMLTGSLIALRWPRVLWVHVPVAVAILGIYLTGSDCPLTSLELNLREQAGEPAYTGGFIGHYVTEPLGFPIHATSTQVGIYVVAILPNVVGYGLLAMRASRRSAPGPGRPRRARRRRTPSPPAAARRAGPRTSSRTSAPGRR